MGSPLRSGGQHFGLSRSPGQDPILMPKTLSWSRSRSWSQGFGLRLNLGLNNSLPVLISVSKVWFRLASPLPARPADRRRSDHDSNSVPRSVSVPETRTRLGVQCRFWQPTPDLLLALPPASLDRHVNSVLIRVFRVRRRTPCWTFKPVITLGFVLTSSVGQDSNSVPGTRSCS